MHFYQGPFNKGIPMSESEKPQPFLSADFGENAGRHDWVSYDEAVSWITQLQNKWNWVGQQRQNPTIENYVIS